MFRNGAAAPSCSDDVGIALPRAVAQGVCGDRRGGPESMTARSRCSQAEVSEDGRCLTYDLLTDKDHGAVRFSFKQDAQNQPLADGLFPHRIEARRPWCPARGFGSLAGTASRIGIAAPIHQAPKSYASMRRTRALGGRLSSRKDARCTSSMGKAFKRVRSFT